MQRIISVMVYGFIFWANMLWSRSAVYSLLIGCLPIILITIILI